MSEDIADRMRDSATESSIRAEETASATSAVDEMEMLSQNYYLVKHRELEEFVAQNCPELMPIFTHLNLTSKIDGKTEKLLRLYIKYAFDVSKLKWRVDETEIKKVTSYLALYIRSIFMIADAKDGWKGRLYTTRGRTYRFEGTEKKKGWLF